MLKLIEFNISGHELFEDGTSFSIQAVGPNSSTTRNRVIDYGNSLFLNKTIGVVGINATGKSTLFNLLEGLSAFYLDDKSIDQTSLQTSLRGNENIIVNAFVANNDGTRYKINTVFSKSLNSTENDADIEVLTTDNSTTWGVEEETIYRKQVTKSTKKKDQFVFSKNDILQKRSELKSEVKAMLSPKDSAFRAFRGLSKSAQVISLVKMVDINKMVTFIDQTPPELLQYLDNSIEFLKYSHNDKKELVNVQLKFKDSSDIITLPKFSDVTNYLSSGTVKGITLFFEMTKALRSGATLLIDEIELHINKQIVIDFIDFFQNSNINIDDATLVYSTHYLELIDDSERKDENYILSKNKKTKITRFSDINDLRTEVKKSEIFQSNYIGGTAPNYDKFMALKKSIENTNQNLLEMRKRLADRSKNREVQDK